MREQISAALRLAIREGRLAPGARLPSWRDLASQLGVARGTVRSAYERLVDEQLILSCGAAGTFVARQLPTQVERPAPEVEPIPPRDPPPGLSGQTGIFQMAAPAQDVFPAKVWARILSGAARASAHVPHIYPDPRGDILLRNEIAGYLSLARGLPCTASQVFVTTGYTGSMSLIAHAMHLSGTSAWTEDPCYPMTRSCLRVLGVEPVPVPVDGHGLVVAEGLSRAPGASIAVVTAGQQAPLGIVLSPQRRRELLDWARDAKAWVIEDDYLGELQLTGRAAPSLAATEGGDRVLHVGTFSKTISPALRVGFLVVPPALVERFDQQVSVMPQVPPSLVQQAVAAFLQGGHFLRHLRRTRQTYVKRREALMACLDAMSATHMAAGLTVLLRLPPGVSDTSLCRELAAHGLGPVPLSLWYASPRPEHSGLLLGIANFKVEHARETCERLMALIHGWRPDGGLPRPRSRTDFTKEHA